MRDQRGVVLQCASRDVGLTLSAVVLLAVAMGGVVSGCQAFTDRTVGKDKAAAETLLRGAGDPVADDSYGEADLGDLMDLGGDAASGDALASDVDTMGDTSDTDDLGDVGPGVADGDEIGDSGGDAI